MIPSVKNSKNITMIAAATPSDITSQPSSLVVTTANLLEVFAEFLNIDVSAGDAASDTLNTYRLQVQQFVDWCDRQKIHPAEVTKDNIKHYRRWMVEKKKFKPATVALKLSVVKRFYQAAVEKGLIPINPAVGVKPPRKSAIQQKGLPTGKGRSREIPGSHT
jgi:integrase/recombinase XerD